MRARANTVMGLREWTETPENRALASGSGLESSHWFLSTKPTYPGTYSRYLPVVHREQ